MGHHLDKEAIEAARKAYDEMTDEQKKKVPADKLKKLQDAEKALAVKEKKAIDHTVADKKAKDHGVTEKKIIDHALTASVVVDAINKLPAADNVEEKDKIDIEAARRLYDALPKEQKMMISADILKKLTDAEKALEEIEKNPEKVAWVQKHQRDMQHKQEMQRQRRIRSVLILTVCVFSYIFNSPVYAVPATTKQAATTEQTVTTEQAEAGEEPVQQEDTWETTKEQGSTEESSLQDLKREYEQVKKEADSNSGTVKKLASEIREMNLRMADEAKLIEKAHTELGDLEMKIEFAERSLIEYEEDMAVEKDHLYNSIRMEYEDGSRSLLSIFLNVDHFSEIKDRIEYSEKISNYLNDRMSSYRFAVDMVSKTKDSLEDLKKQREEELVEYDRKRAKFKQSIDGMAALMKEAKSKADDANSFAAQLETEIAMMEAEERMLLMKNGYTQDSSTSDVTYTGDGTQYYYKSPYPHTDSELTMLAGIIEAEAGSKHYPGMLAVGSVVMNRVESTRFDNTIEGVIYADMQFEPVRTGRLAYILARGPANSCISVAQEVLDGKRNVPNLYFKSAKYAAEHNIEGVNIGGNVFH